MSTPPSPSVASATHRPSDHARTRAPDLLGPFDYEPRTRVVFGSGTLDRLGEIAKEYGSRVLLVTDKGVEKAGHSVHGERVLREAGLEVALFDETQPNPTTDDVDRALAVARAANVDLIVGLGGGSSMDCAKGVNFLLTNGGRMQDYWGVGKATKPMLPMIAVPTTAGTGSEAQSFALIADAETHMKMACGDKRAACRVAILDPDTTVSMPRSVTAATGIDAISHAVETFVTKPRNAISQLFSRRAWRLLAAGFPRVLENPEDVEARGMMLLGAHLAGAAIENSMLGATHALANPLSANYDTVHGVAIGVMLPHVIRFNAGSNGEAGEAGEVGEADPQIAPLYGILARDAAPGVDPQHEVAVEQLAEFVTQLVALSGQPTTLAACDVAEASLPKLAEQAAQQWTTNFNPRPVDATSLEDLYRCAMH